MGDLNTKIGRTHEEDHLRNVVGKYGIGTRNETGKRLLQFCIDNYCITNTVYKQHIRCLFTWTSPDKKTRNQIDYILIRSRWRTSILSVKTLPGADCRTDHQLLVCGFRIKLQAYRRLIQKSRLPPITNEASFATALKRNIAARILPRQYTDPDTMWLDTKHIIVLSLEMFQLAPKLT